MARQPVSKSKPPAAAPAKRAAAAPAKPTASAPAKPSTAAPAKRASAAAPAKAPRAARKSVQQAPLAADAAVMPTGGEEAEQRVTQAIAHNLQANQEAVQKLLRMVWGAGQSGSGKSGGDIADVGYATGMLPSVNPNLKELGSVAKKLTSLMFKRPDLAFQNVAKFWQEQFRIYAGQSALAPEKGDHRFDDSAWGSNPLYKQGMQTYLSLRKGIQEWVDALPIEHKEVERVRFTTSLLTEALAPSNWPTNPAALKRYLETGGVSAVRGLQNMVDDIVHNGGMPSTVKRGVLKVGKDMATTPGKVVYRSEVFELIQYAPSTPDVRARPFLMVPPQINKFYFYDLSPKKSLIRFAVESGLQVFTISWRNPTEEQRDWNFDTYVGAIEEAMDVVCDITGSPDCNIEGGCVAGIGVIALLGSLAARGSTKVHSATLMVTLVDTSAETQLGILATPGLLDMASANTQAHGVFEGAEMGKVFAMLRPNDLIWSYWVNNYLLGNDPPSFDVLAWNADTTRMAAGMHLQILDLVKNNTLVRGDFKVHGQPISLGAITCDQFWLTGSSDHITPWRACYASARMLGGQREFVLSDGGHVQSMVSSPSNAKASYHIASHQPEDPDEWLAGSTEHRQSWWLHWREWITPRSGKLQPAPTALGNANHPPLDDAPGTYVFE